MRDNFNVYINIHTLNKLNCKCFASYNETIIPVAILFFVVSGALAFNLVVTTYILTQKLDD